MPTGKEVKETYTHEEKEAACSLAVLRALRGLSFKAKHGSWVTSATVEQVIVVRSRFGIGQTSGREDREIAEYYDMDGYFLCRIDPSGAHREGRG